MSDGTCRWRRPRSAWSASMGRSKGRRRPPASRKRRGVVWVSSTAPSPRSASKRIGPWVGLTPSRSQSGERAVSGGIPEAGDVNLRRALCQAATVMMHRGRSTWLRTWAAQVARRRGTKRAMVALARRIGPILHRMRVDDTGFRSEASSPTAQRPVRPDDLRSKPLPARMQAFAVPQGPVPTLPRPGPLPIPIEHANATGTDRTLHPR